MYKYNKQVKLPRSSTSEWNQSMNMKQVQEGTSTMKQDLRTLQET